jgi:hypothetical protein
MRGGIGPPEDSIMTNTTLSRRRLLASSMPALATAAAMRAIDQRYMAEYEAKLAALGLKEEGEYADVSAYMTERQRLGKLVHESDEDNVDLDFDGMHDKIFALLEEILDIQPATLQGFAVQVLAIVTAHDDLCEEDGDLELPYGVAEFFRNMCGFVGVPLPEAAA